MRYFFFLAVLCFGGVLSGQAMRIEYFTVTDGLSTRDVNDLHIGADGYLWVATMDGLNRFDGHSFVNFGQGTLSGTRLSRGAIQSINADSERGLIVTFNDFYGYFDRFDPRDFSAEQIRMVPSTGVIGYPRTIVTNRTGQTYVVTIGNEGTIVYEYTPDGFEAIFRQEDDIWRTFAPRIELLPLSNGQFLLYDEEHGFRHLSANDGKVLGTFFPKTSGQRRFYVMEEGMDGFVYLSFRDGYPLFRWWPERGSEPVPVPDLDDGLRYTQVFRDEIGQLLFVATEDIIGKRYPDEYYLVDTAGNFGLFERELPTDRLVTTIAAKDFKETVYLGLREGLGVMERYVNPVQSYLTTSGSDLYRHAVRGITEDAGGNVYVIDTDGELFTLERGSDEMLPLSLFRADSTEVNLREARQLIYDRSENAVWGIAQPIGDTRAGLLFRYGIANGITTVFEIPYPLTSLAIGPTGDLYLGASDNKRLGLLLRFERERGTYYPVKGFNQDEFNVIGMRINYLLPIEDGRLLVGTRNRGLVVYDPAVDSTTYYTAEISGEDITVMDGLSVNSIYEDSLGRWLLGTDNGLQIINPKRGTFQRYGRQDGLSSNFVVGIVPDSLGGYWLSTLNGLVHVPTNPESGTFRRYYLEDGLTNNEFGAFAFHRDRSGRYFFGGDNGLTVFRDRDLSSKSAGSDVMLTEVVVYGRSGNRTMTRNLDELDELLVKANEKSIAISFALPVGQRPSLSQFRVKLEGFNDEWRELRNERTVRYNNLPAGKYRLVVQGAGANGNYGDDSLTLDIRVRQYLIEKLWFQILIVVVIAGLFFGILQAKLRERLRNEQLRTQLSSDIHDEVSGLLAGITLQAELLKNKTEDEKMRTRLHTVGEAGRNAMSKMSDVIWSIDSRRDTIGNLLQRMQEHADEVLLPLDIRYDFRALGFDEEKELPGNIRQDVYFIYKEAINNIARHSSATRVDIELEQFAQTFEMFIRDNGKGRDAVEHNINSANRFTPKSGQGKDNMRMRAQRLRGELLIDDRAGYTLTLRMRRLA